MVYILNKETQKIELDCTKEEYAALTAEQKKEIKSYFLFSGKVKRWVSKSTNNHYSAIRTAAQLGFVDGGTTGERLSYEEELNRKSEKAENKATRYEEYAANAIKRAETLQADFNEYRKDWSWLTQPILAGHKGSQAFANHKNKVMARYEKGFEEYNKSDYYKERIKTVTATADQTQLEDKVYLNNRIKECNKNINKKQEYIKSYEKHIQKINDGEVLTSWKGEPVKIETLEKAIENTLEGYEYEIDKLAFFENCLEELGGVNYSKENIKPGYMVKIRGRWDLVVKANPKTVETKCLCSGLVLKYNYAEVQEMKIPEDFTEVKQEIETIKNPYKVGDILTVNRMANDIILYAYQVTKVTAKTVQIQEINLTGDRKPIKDSFKADQEPQRKKIVKSKYSEFVGAYHNNTHMYKYTG